MTVKGCSVCIKYSALVSSFAIWVTGIAFLVLSVKLYVDAARYLGHGGGCDLFFDAVYVLIFFGCLLILAGFIGCFVIYKEKACAVFVFSLFVLIILIVEIAYAVYGGTYQQEINGSVSERIKNMILYEYNNQSGSINTVDIMQKQLQCCGHKQPEDWVNSDFNRESSKSSISAVSTAETSSGQLSYKVPKSCCIEESKCLNEDLFLIDNIYSQGCVSKMQDIILINVSKITATGLVIALLQYFAFIFSLILYCGIYCKQD